jgi:hypothetical protein
MPYDFWDRDVWSQKLAEWSSQGYNAVFWLGPNEFFEGHHLLLRLPEFPEARELSAADNDRIINQMRWLFRQAKVHGMKNFLYTLTVWTTKAFAKAHGLDKPLPVSPSVCSFHNEPYGGELMPNCCVRNELTRAFTEAIFAEAPQLYEDLDGFYSPLGETLPGDRGTWFREAIAPGLRRSGRKPLIIAHQWQVPLDDYLANVTPKDVYDNTWLGFHAYNSEQITDAKPYPGLVEWAERTGLPTVAAYYPANVTSLPFNSPRLAWETVYEISKIENLQGFAAFRFLPTDLCWLFYEALPYYGRTGEPYSDAPWVRKLEAKYGSTAAAQHFLNAYNISGRIIPELCAVVYLGPDGFHRELSLPYKFMTGEIQESWYTSPARAAEHLVPIPEFSMFCAKDPARFKSEGSDPTQPEYFQWPHWQSEGGSVFDVIPPTQMAKIRKMGEECFHQAELAMRDVKQNQEQAAQTLNYMKAYMLLTRYYEAKVAAAVAAGIYSYSRKPEDKKAAFRLADAAVDSYMAAAQFMHEKLDPLATRLYGGPLREGGAQTLPELIVAEKKDRADLAGLFHWPDEKE